MASGAPAVGRAVLVGLVGAGLVALASASESLGPFAPAADPRAYRLALVSATCAAGLALHERRAAPRAWRAKLGLAIAVTSALAAVAGASFAASVPSLAFVSRAFAFAAGLLPPAVLALLDDDAESPDQALERVQNQCDDPATRAAALAEAKAIHEEALRQANRPDATRTDREDAAQAAYVLAYALKANGRPKAAKKTLESVPVYWIPEGQLATFEAAKTALSTSPPGPSPLRGEG